MRVVIFFLSLCFLLLKGNAHMDAGKHPDGLALAHYAQKVLHPSASGNFIFTAPDTDEEIVYLISDDVEDEDQAAHKYGFQAANYLSQSYLFYPPGTNYRSNCYKVAPFFSCQDKYILQRVLRI